VAILARPTVKTSRLVSSTALDVAVVIDHSLTMGRRAPVENDGRAPAAAPGNGTLFDAAIAQTERLAALLPASATLSIVVAEHNPQILTPTPLKLGVTERSATGDPRGDWARTLQLLRQYKPGMSKANLPAAVTAARELLEHGFNARKIVLVLSDEQRSNWAPGDEAAWKLAVGGSGTDDRMGGISIYSLPVPGAKASASSPNLSVRAVGVMPAFLGVNRRAYVQATVANTGPADVTAIPLQLYLDGRQVASQAIASIPAGQSQTVRIETWFPEAGAHWVKVRADVVDSLDADNEATAAVDVAPRLPVLIIDGQLAPGTGAAPFPHAAFLQAAIDSTDAALEPTPFIQLQTVGVAQLTAQAGAAPVRLDNFPVVILNDVSRLPREAVDRLTEHALRGNGVWIILGPRSEHEFLQLLGRTPLAPFTVAAPVQAAPADASPGTPSPVVSVDIRDASHPIFQLWAGASGDLHNPLAGATLQKWWPLTPTSPQLRIITATTSGDPFILENDVGKAGGRLLLWTSPVGDLDWNNLPLVPNFTPLVNESLFHLASGSGGAAGGQPRQLETGMPLVWTGPASRPIDTATLITPSGARRTLQPQLRGESYLVGDRDTFEPGLYELQFVPPMTAGAVALPPAYFSVNIDRSELDPTLLSAADGDWFRKRGFMKGTLAPDAVAGALGAQPGGVEVWWVVGILLFGLLLAEVVMTRNLARQQRGEGLKDSGLEELVGAGRGGAR
jgi:hypothetical protein